MGLEPSSILILLLLLCLSAIFSGSETALVSLTPAKIKAMKPKKYRSVRLISRLKQNPQKMLTTVLLGNNLVNIAATAYATMLASKIFHSNAITIVTAFMTAVILIFGEILPKAVANRYSMSFARIIVYFLYIMEIILYPVIWILEKFISKVLNTFGNSNISSVTEDEFKAMVSIGAAEGTLEKHEQELIENVLEFDDIEADAIMTPRVKIDAISRDLTVKDAIDLASSTYYSRIPVYDCQIDNIVGTVATRDLLKLSRNEENLSMKMSEVRLGQVLKVPFSRKIHSLFKEMQKRRLHMAFIYDEHGGLEGLVTMEDILEELVGEILDESDNVEDDTDEIRRLDKKTVLVDGTVPLKDIEEILKVEIDEYDHNEHVALVILDILNRYPRKGEVVMLGDHLECKVQRISQDNKVIEKVRVRKI